MADGQHESPEELEVARRIAEVSRTSRGVDLGDPVLHDDGRSHSQYDVEFPDPTPPVALEVTSITDENFFGTAGASRRLAEIASIVAQEADTGRWVFDVSKDVTLAGDTTAWMVDVVAGRISGCEGDLPPGVIRVHNYPGEESGVDIATWSSPSVGPLSPLHPIEIGQLIERKRSVLERAQGHERHLAIQLRDLRSRDLPPVPDLPEDIDVLWLLWWQRDLTLWIERSDTDWQYNRHPWV